MKEQKQEIKLDVNFIEMLVIVTKNKPKELLAMLKRTNPAVWANTPLWLFKMEYWLASW